MNYGTHLIPLLFLVFSIPLFNVPVAKANFAELVRDLDNYESESFRFNRERERIGAIVESLDVSLVEGRSPCEVLIYWNEEYGAIGGGLKGLHTITVRTIELSFEDLETNLVSKTGWKRNYNGTKLFELVLQKKDGTLKALTYKKRISKRGRIEESEKYEVLEDGLRLYGESILDLENLKKKLDMAISTCNSR